MRCLARNMRTFHYALYLRKEPHYRLDEYGNRVQSGEYQLVYDNPVSCRGNISAATGETVTQLFGVSESYDKLIMLDDPNTPIDECSILWLDSVPEMIEGEEGHYSQHDYIVKRVARSLNSATIAVSNVSVHNG